MEGNPFGKQENILTTKQRMEIVESADEILKQLNVSALDYKKAIGELKLGNNDDLEYLKEMQANLVAWREGLKEIFRKRTDVDMYDEEILRQVNARLYELSEEFEKIEKKK